MLSYGSTIEAQDVALLEFLGFEVVNPNSQEIEAGVQTYILERGKENCMDFFKEIIDYCDLIAFRGMPNGEILSGVAFEVNYAQSIGRPVIELPCNVKRRSLDYLATKQILIELGHYKVWRE